MPPMAEQDSIINNFVKKPPAEKPLTKMMPPKRVMANIMAPQARPTFKPFLRLLFAAVKPAEKHPAQRAMADITESVSGFLCPKIYVLLISITSFLENYNIIFM